MPFCGPGKVSPGCNFVIDLPLFIQLQRDIQQQPVIKIAQIQPGQFRYAIKPILQGITMNKQRL